MGIKDNFAMRRPKLNKEYFGMRGSKLNKAVAALAGISFMLFGYDQGVMGSLLTLPSFLDTFPEIDAVNDPSKATIQGCVVSIYEIGCMFGALFAMFYGDGFGRRKMIWFGAIIMTVGTILQSSSFSLGQFIVGRVITGVGNGFQTATVPMWLSECAKAESRGTLNMISASLLVLGIAISYWIDFGLYFAKGNVSWRFPIAFQIVFALFMICFILRMPESPRWLVKNERIEEAKHVFASLADVDENDKLIIEKIMEIEELSKQEDEKFNIKSLFSFGPNKHFHRAMLGAFSQVMQQITGINLITYYAGTIYESYLHMGPVPSRVLAACNGTEYFLAACCSYFVIERVGRRKLMIYCAAGQAATMAILCGTAWAVNNNNDTKAAIATIVFSFVFNTVFALGWLGVPWLYPAEISPLEIRASVNGLSTACNWGFNFMVVMITPVAFANIGAYTYAIFAAINFIMVPVVVVFYPETAGRSLEDMDIIFRHSNPKTPWDVVGLARNFDSLEFADAEVFSDKASSLKVEDIEDLTE